MFGIDRKAARWAWTIFLIALAILLVWLARSVVLLFVIALFFAYLLSPLVDFVDRFRPPRFSRTLSIAFVFLALIGLVATVGVWIATRVISEATELVARLPEWMGKADEFTRRPMPPWLEPIRERLVEFIRSWFEGGDRIAGLLRSTGQKVLAGVGTIVLVFLVPLLAFYFLKDGPEFRKVILGQVRDTERRRFLIGTFNDIHVLLGQYMRALMVLSVVTFVCYSVFFGVTGIPYAILLAGIAGVLEFIPFLGPVVGAITVMIVAGFSGFPHLWWIAVFVIVYQVFQNYVVQPFVMSSGVEVHPLLVLFGAMAGEQIGGLMGVFLSIPVIATARIILVRIDKTRDRQERGLMERAAEGESSDVARATSSEPAVDPAVR